MHSILKKLSVIQKRSLIFIVFMGFVSLFADITYEGARSITGPFLAVLGANAAIVGFVSGLGELLGYSLRFVSGYFVDKTKQYWSITFIGYAINLLVVPLLALANQWWLAAVLIVLERVGKAIRVPPRDAMLSRAGQSIGMGIAFGIHEAMDQLGAMIGPLIVAAILFFKESYRAGFACLLIPALFALSLLCAAKLKFPRPEHLDIQKIDIHTEDINRTFWLYLIGASFIGAGFADFPLIAYHFHKQNILSAVAIPVSYALAMGINSISSLLLGHLYDKKGFIILIITTIITAFFAPLVFLGDEIAAYLGVVLMAVGVSSQQSLMRAIVGNLITKDKRGSAYGIFNMCYGISWFLGSCAMGIIYDHSIPELVAFIMILQFISIPWLLAVKKRIK